jgi:hypothetical protein
MSSGSFIVHSGGKLVDRVEVERVATPPATESWCPIPHGRVVELVKSAMAELGMEIANEQYALANEGNRFFALFDLRGGHDDYNLVLGLRNSHDKTFPAALSLGSRVFVCDNLAFSGEVQIARRHTRYIERDFPALVSKATAALVNQRGIQEKRIETYKGFGFDDGAAHDFIVRAARAGSFPGSDILNVAKEWHEPSYPDFKPRTAWSLFNAFTEVGKKWGRALPSRTQRLHGMFDNVCGVAGSLAALKEAANEDVEVIVNN